MKKIFLLGLTFTMIDSVFAYSGIGVCNYGNQTVSSVVCYGPTVLKQTIVTGNIKVTGALQAENISAKEFVVDGSVDLKNAQIAGPVTIKGALNADHVVFNTGIAATTDSVILNNSKVNGLLTVTSSDKAPYVQVQCGSVITDAVLFDGKAGVVQITGDSMVKGKVVNGSLEFVKRDCGE